MEKCNECGESVAPGSGKFVNRVPDLNSPEERKEMGKQHPEGDFICAECEAQADAEFACDHLGRAIDLISNALSHTHDTKACAYLEIASELAHRAEDILEPKHLHACMQFGRGDDEALKHLETLPHFGDECKCLSTQTRKTRKIIHEGSTSDEIIEYCLGCGGIVV